MEDKKRPEDFEGCINAELRGVVENGYRDLFFNILTLIEIALPHEKKDGSENEKKFNLLRSRVLRIGNDNIRALGDLFENFVVFKYSEYKKIMNPEASKVIFHFKNEVAKLQKGQESSDE